jgi:elongation factor P hydroxylase
LDTQGVFETLKDTLSADKIWNFQQPSEIESWHSSISGTPDFVEYLRTTELDMQQITEDLELQPSTIEWLSSSTSVPDIEKSLDTGSTAPLSDLQKLEKQQKDAEKNQKQILRRSVTLIIVLWFIIDSSARGLIYPSLFEISWIDMAGANCSVLDNLGYDLQSQCETAKSQAQAVVGFCIFALLYNIAELLRLLRT